MEVYKMEKLVKEILHFGGYYDEDYRLHAEFELEGMSDDAQRKLLSDLENNHVHFGYQVFSRYLTKEEINKFQRDRNGLWRGSPRSLLSPSVCVYASRLRPSYS
jgi:hypothetical protein